MNYQRKRGKIDCEYIQASYFGLEYQTGGRVLFNKLLFRNLHCSLTERIATQ